MAMLVITRCWLVKPCIFAESPKVTSFGRGDLGSNLGSAGLLGAEDQAWNPLIDHIKQHAVHYQLQSMIIMIIMMMMMMMMMTTAMMTAPLIKLQVCITSR